MSNHQKTENQTGAGKKAGLRMPYTGVRALNVEITGTNPSPLSFETAPGGNQLGVFLYPSPTEGATGKICTVATLTPAGVNAVITSGWRWSQFTQFQTYENGKDINLPGDRDWHPELPLTKNTKVPDTSDNLYLIDDPDLLGPPGDVSAEVYYNFYDCVFWNNVQCCENVHWYWRARWKAGNTPPITYTNLNKGDATLPTSPFYPP